MKILTIAFIFLLQFATPGWTKDSPKSIAHDFTVVRAEFGRFPNGKGPHELKGKHVVFQRSNNVDSTGYSYGWRIRLETPRKSVHVFEVWDERNSEPAMGDPVDVVDGYIYHDWDVVMGTKKGKHSVEVFIEKQPIKKFVYFVH
jgi:hypothetical protein